MDQRKFNTTKLTIVVITCITALLLAAISAWVYINNRQLEQQQVQFKAQQKTTAFKNNQACQQYSNGIKSTIDDNNSSKFALGIETLDTLFYSSKDNACIYTYDFTNLTDGSRKYLAVNALTNSKVASFDFPAQYSAYKKYVLDSSDGEVNLN